MQNDDRHIPRITWDFALQLMYDEYRIDQNLKHNIIILTESLHSVPEHTHDFFEAVYILSGTYTHQINQNTELLHAGDLCILPPAARHSIYTTGSGLGINILIQPAAFMDIFSGIISGEDILGNFLKNSIYRKNTENYLLFHTGQDESVHNIILDMLGEMMEADEYTDTIISGMLVTLYTKLIRTYKNVLKSASESHRDNEILAIIYEHYNTITLSELAEYLHYTIPYCSKYLKNHLGCNFSELLKQIRFQKAENLLENSNTTITKIGKELGYENPENFVRAFKQRYQMTPSQYRALHSPEVPPPIEN
ncbi:MAG: AraC family transcriptional regulator [Roseburia sp.]|nr:AraC family transcriptional regulator [Roseburia sp.]MCM1243085.1 AraC family transcriptional regulator [Roseburia sp.]